MRWPWLYQTLFLKKSVGLKELIFIVLFIQQWNDALLHWNPEDYDGLLKIMVPPEDVWIPDIVLYNL